MRNQVKQVLTAVVLCGFILCGSACQNGDQLQKDGKEFTSSLPVIKVAPLVHGVAEDSTEFSSAILQGSVWIASFMFSSCQGVCPVMNGNLSSFQSDVLQKDVKFVSITVDPDNDTPEVLSEYAREYKAQKKRWYFVRMSLDSVRELSVKGFLLSDPIEPAAHSPRYVLVDKANNIRGYYDSMDSLKVLQLKVDIDELLKE